STPTPQIVRVTATPALLTSTPSKATATVAPTGAAGPEFTSTPIVEIRVVEVPVIEYRQLPPYPCLWTVISAIATVGEQMSEAAKQGVLLCDPDSAVVPRVTLDLP
ncbi:MAG TPA: hypothetical protein VFH61_11130, partial [Thermoleophilia bacterium]|nr:hypothetical protein [Thermoleophilia bacterium]